MAVETATGRATCTVCSEKITKGQLCWHQTVNTRAAPFFCRRCVAKIARLVGGETKEVLYEIHDTGDGLVATELGAVVSLVEIPDLATAERSIAMALGIATERVFRVTWKTWQKYPEFLAEIPN